MVQKSICPCFCKVKPASVTYLWVEEDLLYLGMCQAFWFERYCSCCRAVFGGRRSISQVGIAVYDGFKHCEFITGCSSLVGVHGCLFKAMATKHSSFNKKCFVAMALKRHPWTPTRLLQLTMLKSIVHSYTNLLA